MSKIPEYGRIAISTVASVTLLIAIALAYIHHDQTSIAILVGAIVANGTTVVNYWLGSSSSSAAKDATIAGRLPATTPREG